MVKDTSNWTKIIWKCWMCFVNQRKWIWLEHCEDYINNKTLLYESRTNLFHFLVCLFQYRFFVTWQKCCLLQHWNGQKFAFKKGGQPDHFACVLVSGVWGECELDQTNSGNFSHSTFDTKDFKGGAICIHRAFNRNCRKRFFYADTKHH